MDKIDEDDDNSNSSNSNDNSENSGSPESEDQPGSSGFGKDGRFIVASKDRDLKPKLQGREDSTSESSQVSRDSGDQDEPLSLVVDTEVAPSLVNDQNDTTLASKESEFGPGTSQTGGSGKGNANNVSSKDPSSLRASTPPSDYASGKFCCGRCGARCVTPSDLVEHIVIVHSTFRPYTCLICRDNFRTRSELRSHLSSGYHATNCASLNIPFEPEINQNNTLIDHFLEDSLDDLVKSLTNGRFNLNSISFSFPSDERLTRNKLPEADEASEFLATNETDQDGIYNDKAPSVKFACLKKRHLSAESQNDENKQRKLLIVDRPLEVKSPPIAVDFFIRNLLEQPLDHPRIKCDLCGTKFSSSSDFKIHTEVHMRSFSPKSCENCKGQDGPFNNRFTPLSKKFMHRRKQIIPSKVQPKQVKAKSDRCSSCRQNFKYAGCLMNHLRSQSHLRRLEQLGQLPVGLVNEMQRQGTSFSIVSRDDNRSNLRSLRGLTSEIRRNTPVELPHHYRFDALTLPENSLDLIVEDGSDDLAPIMQRYHARMTCLRRIYSREPVPQTDGPPNGETAASASQPARKGHRTLSKFNLIKRPHSPVAVTSSSSTVTTQTITTTTTSTTTTLATISNTITSTFNTWDLQRKLEYASNFNNLFGKCRYDQPLAIPSHEPNVPSDIFNQISPRRQSERSDSSLSCVSETLRQPMLSPLSSTSPESSESFQNGTVECPICDEHFRLIKLRDVHIFYVHRGEKDLPAPAEPSPDPDPDENP